MGTFFWDTVYMYNEQLWAILCNSHMTALCCSKMQKSWFLLWRHQATITNDGLNRNNFCTNDFSGDDNFGLSSAPSRPFSSGDCCFNCSLAANNVCIASFTQVVKRYCLEWLLLYKIHSRPFEGHTVNPSKAEKWPLKHVDVYVNGCNFKKKPNKYSAVKSTTNIPANKHKYVTLFQLKSSLGDCSHKQL